jgi:hypothetical protein
MGLAVEDNLSFRDMFYAYRKAKVDAYYERSVASAVKFARFESDLEGNLHKLLDQLNTPNASPDPEAWLGEPLLVPKALDVKARPPKKHGVAIGTEAGALTQLRRSKVTAKFRIVADPSVEGFVLSALWINRIGIRLDQLLAPSVRGSRLRRLRGQDGALGEYHLNALGSFQPYYAPYRRWRDDGLTAIGSALNAKQQVAAITMDLANYYHRIDIGFLNLDFFRTHGVVLSDTDAALHVRMMNLIAKWQLKCDQLATADDQYNRLGVPIGLPASRIIANIALAPLDVVLAQNVGTIFYGRYVDDLLLVFPFRKNEPDAAYNHLVANSKGMLTRVKNGTRLNLPPDFVQRSLLFSFEKQKVFILNGAPGHELIASIRNHIGSVASERRMMLGADDLESAMSAKVIANTEGEAAHTLRHADSLSVKRLGWSLQLRNVERIAADLAPSEWKAELSRFLTFAQDHVLRIDQIFSFADSLPRLMAITLTTGCQPDATNLLSAFDRVCDELCSIANCGVEIAGRVIAPARRTAVLKMAKIWPRSVLLESAAKHVNLSAAEEISYAVERHYAQEPRHLLEALQMSDLAAMRFVEQAENPSLNYATASLLGAYNFGEVLSEISAHQGVPLPRLFPTRPFTPSEVLIRFVPRALFENEDRNKWTSYVRALRGVFVAETYVNSTSIGARDIEICRLMRTGKTLLAIPSFRVDNAYFEAGAMGTPNLSRERYSAICVLINLCVTASPQPTHLLMPELSLPKQWLGTVTRVLGNRGISLVAGLDYVHDESNGTLSNQAALSLVDESLGYRTHLSFIQKKVCPALHEEAELRRLTSRQFDKGVASQTIYSHGALDFAVFICSEFTDAKRRAELRGEVDAIWILSWNQDLDSFDALVDAACLDIHAHIAVTNNRQYGNSRMRSPDAIRHRRLRCQIRGGLNDHLVVVEVETESLRKFQSHATRATEPYKPVSDGFQIANRRRFPKGRK